jgi:nucleoside-diphosphate-sugar epimerase
MYELVRRGLQEGEVRLKGGHDLVRTYCHADDTAQILIKLALRCSNSTVNVGGSEAITMRNLAKLIALKTGANYVEEVDETPPTIGHKGAPSSVSLNLDLMRELTGFTEFTSLEEGIVQVIEYYRGKV